MNRFTVSVAIAAGLAALSAAAGATAAGGDVAWRYVAVAASGSASWRYSGPGGGGVDSVVFGGRALPAGQIGLSGLLHGRTTYTDQNSRGCGPVTHTRRQNYAGPNFSVQPPYVIVRWRFPMPAQSYCHLGRASSVAQQLQRLMSQRIPLARFTCKKVWVQLGGRAKLAQGGTVGTLAYQANVTLERG
jgi:hypothetical protein